MTVATISVPNLPAALRARDEGIALAEAGQSAEQDRLVIDRVIRHLADLGEPFSVNDARELLPPVAGSMIGARFNAASGRGDIVRVGDTLAEHEAGHARRVGMWVKATGSKPIANRKQVANHDASQPLTEAEELTVRAAHWALAGKGGIRNTGDARKVIRDLLDVLGRVTGVNGGDGTLM